METVIAILILFILSSLVLGYSTYNLLRKNEQLEDYIYRNSDVLVKLKEIIDSSSERLQELDTKGSFSSDDEIGFFFSYVQNIQKLLEDFISKNIKTL